MKPTTFLESYAKDEESLIQNFEIVYGKKNNSFKNEFAVVGHD